MVGADPDEVDFHSEGWWKNHSWTKQQQEEFTTWLQEHFKKKKNREGVVTCCFNKAERERAAREFVFNYGWVIKD
jgi:hypothetical protein